MSVVAILQARMSSTRLPGKVLKPILETPMLARQIERLSRAKSLDRLVVATSTERADEPVADLCQTIGIDCFRGSLDDVLDRFYQAACKFGADEVVRLTGDCPLADPDIIDLVVRSHLEARSDYTANVFPPTWPDGLDVEVVRFNALAAAWSEAKLPSEREHVTYFIEKAPERFCYTNVAGEKDLSFHRWTVDGPEDFEFVSRIYEALYPRNQAFSTSDILNLLEDRPSLLSINAGIERNAGFAKSLEQDQQYLKKLES